MQGLGGYGIGIPVVDHGSGSGMRKGGLQGIRYA